MSQISKPTTPIPPKAKKVYSEHIIHGDKRVDYYSWIQNREDPEVTDYLNAENRYAEEVMSSTSDLQQKLYDEYFSHIKEDDDSVPYKWGDYFYFTREEKGKSYKMHYRRRAEIGSAEELILDENEIAKHLKYCGIEAEPSPDNKILAYMVDPKGNHSCKVYFKNMSDSRTMEDVLENIGQIIWGKNSEVIYYCLHKENDFGTHIFRHTLGTPQKDDMLIMERTDERYYLYMYKSKSRRFIFIDTGSFLNTECLYIDLDKSVVSAELFSKRKEEVIYFVEHNGDKFYVLTNYDAPDYRVMTCPLDATSIENWKEIVPETKGRKKENIELFKDHLVIKTRSNALTGYEVIRLSDGSRKDIVFPEPAYSTFPHDNPEFESSRFRYFYMSFVTPQSYMEYDMNTGEYFNLKEKEVPHFDKNDYISERHYADSHDGKKIPVSLIYKRGIKKDGSNPMLVFSYGSYGISSEVFFSTIRIPLLDRGFIFAVAHVRGGGELGENWYKEGKLMNKKNTFYDFISVCEYLIQEEYTYIGGISAEGASAGGLLMGAIANMRPDLFKCILAIVPYVDVLNTFFDGNVKNAEIHYGESGNPNIEEEYFYMKSYSPYENVAELNYPNILFTAGFNDIQVHFWEPAKMTAKLREFKKGDSIILLKTRMESAHHGSSGKYDLYREFAFNYSFLLKCYDIEK